MNEPIGKGRLKPGHKRGSYGPRPKLNVTQEELLWLIQRTNLAIGHDRLKHFVRRVRQVA